MATQRSICLTSIFSHYFADDISLLPLPAYSPELNPIELVLQKIKADSLNNTTFKNCDDIVEKCVHAWNSFCDNEGNIKRLCSRAWAA